MVQILRPEDFSDEENRALWEQVIVPLWESSPVADAHQLLAQIAASDLTNVFTVPRLHEIIGRVSTPSPFHAEWYARLMLEDSARRRALRLADAVTRRAHDRTEKAGDLVAFIIEEARGFDREVVGGTAGMADVMHEALEARQRAADGISGVPTGFAKLDELLGGLQPGELILLAARPSVGKSALAMGIVDYVGIVLARPVIVFSLEMSKIMLGQRMISARAKVDGFKFKTNQLTPHEIELCTRAVGEISSAPIIVCDRTNLRIHEMTAIARRFAKEQGIALIVVDYLQLMEGVGDNRQEQVASISRGLKAMSRELNIPVLALSQLNRVSEAAERAPRISELRESGALEQDSDVVLLLHREAAMHKGDEKWAAAHAEDLFRADLIIGKQRNGPCDKVGLVWFPNYTRFEQAF